MMPEQNLSQSSTDSPAGPLVQPTITPTKLTLHDLFTGGWKRPLTGLPTTLGRPLARLGTAAKTRSTAWSHRRSAGSSVPR
jgi:hypothetical protein